MDPKCIFVQRERNLDVHDPVTKLVASLARNRGVTFTEIHNNKLVIAQQCSSWAKRLLARKE